MQKSLLIICFLSLALALPCLADSDYDPVTFNKTVSAPGLLSMVEGDFEFNLGSGNSTSALLRQGNTSHILGEGECKRIGYERICHEEKLTDKKARISIVDLRAHIEGRIYAVEDRFKVGEEFELKFALNNTGLNDAEDLVAKIKLPQNLSVDHTSRCEHNLTHIFLEDNIPVNGGLLCKAYVTAFASLETEFYGTMSYENYEVRYEVNSSEMELSAGIPFRYNISFSKLIGLEPLEPSTFTINFENNASENFSIEEVTLIFGKDGILLSDNDDRRTSKGPYSVKSWNKNLEEGENYTMTHDFAFTKTNLSDLVEIVMTYQHHDDNSTDYTFSQFFPYSTIAVPALIEISPANLTFETLTHAQYNISIMNQYKYLSFKGYNLDLDASIHKDITRQLPYDKDRLLAEVSFTAPKTPISFTRAVNITIIAQTDFGETFVYSEEIPITILALQSIEVEKIIDEQEQTITVFATNLHRLPVDVVFDERVDSFVFLNGDTSASFTLEPGVRTEVMKFSYVFDSAQSVQEALFSTEFAYTYLDNTIARSTNTTIQVQDSIIIPTLQNTTNSSSLLNTTNQNSSSINDSSQSSVLSSLPSFVWYLAVFIVLLIIAVILKLSMPNIFTLHHEKKKKQQGETGANSSENIIAQYNELLNKNREIHETKKEYHIELSRLQDEVRKVNARLKGFEAKLPEESKKLDKKRSQVMNVFDQSHARRQKVEDHIHGLQEQEKALLAYEQRLNTILKEIKTQEGSLGQDYELLKKDQQSLIDEISTVQERMQDAQLQQKTVTSQIRDIKKKHAQEIKERIDEISLRWEDSLQLQNRLKQEQKVLTEEFKKIERDLQSSLNDVEDSEKIFKEAELAVAQKGEQERGARKKSSKSKKS